MPKHSALASPKASIAVLRDFGLYTKKSLGQHFLIDDAIVGKIMALAAPATNEVLLEVGPGIGTLTLALLATGRPVIAVEKDAALLPVLQAVTADAPNFTLLHQDALDYAALAAHLSPGDGPLMLVANLPYQVAATLVLGYFERLPQLRAATVMVQREVAGRMTARPGTKAYGAYTVKLALLVRPAGSFEVVRSSFLPAPRVDSTVIRLERLPAGAGDDALPAGSKDYPAITALIDASFAMRRKKLINNLKAAWPDCPPEHLRRALAEAGVNEAARAEELDPTRFQRLFACLPPLT